MRYILPLILFCTGCESLQYQGTSPTLRTLRDDPHVDDLYVGADAKFAVLQPGEKPVTPSRRNDGIDAWNPPIVWDNSAPAASVATIDDAQR